MSLPDWIGQVVVAGGGGAVIALALFKYLGQNWIKHQLAKDLERAKAEISLLSSRRMKLHDKEYEVFPELWARLNEGVNSLGEAVNPITRSPDFRRMPELELQEWVKGSDLSDKEKSYFLGAEDKINAYTRIQKFRSLKEAADNLQRFSVCLQNNRIFLSPDIKEKFNAIGDLTRNAWVAENMDWEYPSRNLEKEFLDDTFITYQKEIKPLLSELELLVQNKLFPESKPTSDKGGQKDV
jgi:hypothetical protein